jgi:hypothetical protein
MAPALREALVALAAAMMPARDPWWVIGSAAVVLLGAETEVRDVDVLLSESDVHRVLPALGLPIAPGIADARFRSAVFTTWLESTLPIEFMVGTRYAIETEQRILAPKTRECIMLGNVQIFVPARAELVAILRAFDRPKDRDRADLLDV